MNTEENEQIFDGNPEEKDTKIKNKKKPIKKIKATKFDDLEGKFLLVRVGCRERPATDGEIKDVSNSLKSLLEENNINCLVYVTHHEVVVDIIERPSKVKSKKITC